MANSAEQPDVSYDPLLELRADHDASLERYRSLVTGGADPADIEAARIDERAKCALVANEILRRETESDAHKNSPNSNETTGNTQDHPRGEKAQPDNASDKSGSDKTTAEKSKKTSSSSTARTRAERGQATVRPSKKSDLVADLARKIDEGGVRYLPPDGSYVVAAEDSRNFEIWCNAFLVGRIKNINNVPKPRNLLERKQARVAIQALAGPEISSDPNKMIRFIALQERLLA